MIIIPAIDLKDQNVVRLSQGKMSDEIVYSSDPVTMAEKWYRILVDSGSQEYRLHIVDLNGAFEGKPVHAAVIKKITKAFPDLKIEIGGGIRSLETIQEYFDAGVSYCILGTAAIKNPQLLKDACDKHPGRIILGVDAKDGMVATEGWDKVSRTSAIDLVKSFEDLKIESVVYTDIAKDGMLQGMNIPALKIMVQESPFPIIASGGFTSLKDVRDLKNISNIYGMIAGKALYENKVKLEDAVKETW
ncbi:1-(5-phosphoribosyl)-5-[(5-phosphoribosylamino)methylideneamino]imidazole-4-carboxamide isomerase [bacterium]|nr:1-(5-phosphoribosyl)-5-[(5-phosphoribosylamino)methylideneamino]imidazole-4-carboxamide isomerase [bacterium]